MYLTLQTWTSLPLLSPKGIPVPPNTSRLLPCSTTGKDRAERLVAARLGSVQLPYNSHHTFTALKRSKRERMQAKTMETKGSVLKTTSEQREIYFWVLRWLHQAPVHRKHSGLAAVKLNSQRFPLAVEVFFFLLASALEKRKKNQKKLPNSWPTWTRDGNRTQIRGLCVQEMETGPKRMAFVYKKWKLDPDLPVLAWFCMPPIKAASGVDA